MSDVCAPKGLGREDAKKAGFFVFYRDEPCPRCGGHEFRCQASVCNKCRPRDLNSIPSKRECAPKDLSREDAKKAGFFVFYCDTPCQRCGCHEFNFHGSSCVHCRTEYRREYNRALMRTKRALNREKKAEQNRAWREKNREKQRESKRKSAKRKRERIAAAKAVTQGDAF